MPLNPFKPDFLSSVPDERKKSTFVDRVKNLFSSEDKKDFRITNDLDVSGLFKNENKVIGSQSTETPVKYEKFFQKPETNETKTPAPAPQFRQTGKVPAPVPDYANSLIGKYFGGDADKAAIALWSENKTFDPRAVHQNSNGTKDYGLWQINDSTFYDFQSRHRKKMEELGLNGLQDLFDPEKNTRMAQLIQAEQGWNAWYGWKDNGFSL